MNYIEKKHIENLVLNYYETGDYTGELESAVRQIVSGVFSHSRWNWHEIPSWVRDECWSYSYNNAQLAIWQRKWKKVKPSDNPFSYISRIAWLGIVRKLKDYNAKKRTYTNYLDHMGFNEKSKEANDTDPT